MERITGSSPGAQILREAANRGDLVTRTTLCNLMPWFNRVPGLPGYVTVRPHEDDPHDFYVEWSVERDGQQPRAPERRVHVMVP